MRGDLRPPMWMRIVLSAVVVVHLAAMWGSTLRYTPLGPPVRAWTQPWERALGVHQTWPMFVGVPRRTVWLRMVGELPDGSEVPLPDLGGPPELDGVIWRYSRRGKLDRNACARKRDYLRAALVRWQCRAAKAEGTPLRKVSMQRVTVFTPPLAEHTPDRRSWRTETEELERWNCAR